MSRFDLTKIVKFEEELRELVQRYVGLGDVDALQLETPLLRAAQQVALIGIEERRWAKVEREMKQS